MFIESGRVTPNDLPDSFARFFDTKIKDLLNSVGIDEDVYNGKKLVIAKNSMFMESEPIKDCVLSIKSKNSEGYDRIIQRILRDGLEYLLPPLTNCLN
jgi:hypothetical protein